MDFFTAQDQARRKTRWLVFCFLLATAGICVVTYMFAAAFLLAALFGRVEALRPVFLDGRLFAGLCALVAGCFALGSFWKTMQISRRGGELIALQMGGRLIGRATADPAEKRLINVTDEMAIAAGMPPPAAYVLDGESGMNAFAAGLSARDSIVCVTRGLLDAMSRDELQGVVGHEVSHIVNGDSRLNLKLAGVLYGLFLVTVIANGCMRARGRKAVGIILFGVVLHILGSIGLLSGKIIQAAVSREREYLADASSAQLTRNPPGLASALGKLLSRGSRVRHPGAAAVSHFFFSAAGSLRLLSGIFATHPPLEERIARLGGVRPSGVRTSGPAQAAAPATGAPVAALGGARGGVLPANIALAQRLLAELPEGLRQRARTVGGAVGVVGGLFLSGRPDVRAAQEGAIPPASLPVARELFQWLSAQPERGARHRLVWMDLALPVLREAPGGEWRGVFAMAESLICADGRVSSSEFALYSLLRGALLSPSERRNLRGELRMERLDRDISDVLALIAHAGSGDGAAAAAAYGAAMDVSPARRRLPLPEASALSLDSVSRALAHLALASPKYRERALRACAVAVRHDGEATPVEHELIRAFAQALDRPAPPVETVAGN